LFSATLTTYIADNSIFATSIAQIQILSPGPESRLTSPIELEAQLYPGADGKVRIELFTSDGRLLARKILMSADDTDLTVQFTASIDFEVSRPTAAILLVSAEDQYGRLQSLNSLDLTLLSEGEQLITPAAEADYGIQILSPQQGDQISGGSITITGQASSQPGRPLIVQLITREGRVLSFGEVYSHFEQDSELGTFETKLSYAVKGATWVQVAITENDPQIPSPVHFNAIEVLLIP